MSGSTIVSTAGALAAAITTADSATPSSSTTYTIDIAGNITLSTDLPAINLHNNETLVITNDGGSILNGDNLYRGLFVYGGDVIVNNLTLLDTAAIGGAGGAGDSGGGGGGAGLGGGLFIGPTGTVTLNQVYFSGNKAVGGAGGSVVGGGGGLYGGGGGLGGAGGGGSIDGGDNVAGGGGGIGNTASGGVALISSGGTFLPGSGILLGPGSGSGGTGVSGKGAPLTNPADSDPGGSFGGGGGYGVEGSSSGNFYGQGGGGGGISGSSGSSHGTNANGVGLGYGGAGGWGGGGGGGYTKGAKGGFGGGGGAGYLYSGKGGWGGGGAGSGFGSGNTGGGSTFGGGTGGASDKPYGGAGGGGLGAGGDIFNDGGSLIIGSGTLSGGSVQYGAGGTGSNSTQNGTSGQAIGSGIFLYGTNQTATFTPALGKSVTVNDVIIDQKGAGNGSNTGRVILNGAGELIFGAGNTFSGGTTLEGSGTLELNHSGAGGTGGITFGGGANRLLIESSDLGDGGTFANTITNFVSGDVIDLAGLTFHSGATATFNGSVLTVISGGATDSLNTTSAPSSLDVVEDAGGGSEVIDPVFTITSTADLANDLNAINVGGVDAFLNASYVFDFVSSFAIASTQTINLSAGDTLTFNGGNATSGGGYDVVSGSLVAGATGAFGNGAMTVASGAVLNLNGFNQTIGDLSGAGSITLGSAALTEGTSNSTTLSGAISGTGALIKQGSGTLTLTGANAYTGATTITAGALQIGSGSTSGSIGNTSGVTDNATLIFDNSGNVGFTQAISGSGALVQQGSGTLTLGSNNSYGGGTTIDAGTLVASADASLGNSGGALTFAGGVLAWNEGASAVASSRNVAMNAFGTIIVAGSGLVTMAGNVTGGGGLTVSGPLTLSGSLEQIGNLLVNGGSVTLSGSESFGGGLTVEAGSLNLAAGASLPPVGTVVVNGGTFNLNGVSQAIAVLSGSGGEVALGTGTLTEGSINNSSYAGEISGAGALIKQGIGTLLLSGANAISGGVTIAAGTLEIGSGGSIGSGTIDFLSPSASLRIDATTAPANLITRFATGDTIDLHGVAYASGDRPNYDSATGELDIETSGGGTVASVFFGQNNGLAEASFTVAEEAGGTGIVITDDVPCFLRGTLIRTPDGEVPVETLTVGDWVVTLSGIAQRIAWVGIGRVLVTRGRRCAATPIVVRKGALGDNVPHHDLRITKGHALYLDDVLIPAEFLVNHRSIAWDDRAQEVEFYHIEIAQHDVLLANGAPAETYRDDGNRWLFRNANSGWDLPPKPVYAPVLTGGAVVDAVWRRLLDRAGPRPGVLLTDDPDLHLLADGQRCDGVCGANGWFAFRLPRPPRTLRMVSLAASPAELGLTRDPRVLGVALRQARARQGTRFAIINASDEALSDGFHAFEPACGWRWSDGDADLPAVLWHGFSGPLEILLQIGGIARYVDGAREQAA